MAAPGALEEGLLELVMTQAPPNPSMFRSVVKKACLEARTDDVEARIGRERQIEREKERERERDRERQKDRRTDRERESESERETDRQRDRGRLGRLRRSSSSSS